jgi:uncharacterized protein YjdB
LVPGQITRLGADGANFSYYQISITLYSMIAADVIFFVFCAKARMQD